MFLTDISLWGAVIVACVVFVAMIALAFFDSKMLRRMFVIFAATVAQMAVVVAVVIVISMRLVGTLLVTAILVSPSVAAMRIAKSFRAVTTVAATFSVVCSAIGILVAVVAGTLLTRVDEEDGKRYFGCLIGEGGGCSCCEPSGVLDFRPKESFVWPTNFPPVYSRITVTGRLKMLKVGPQNDPMTIPCLVDADISWDSK